MVWFAEGMGTNIYGVGWASVGVTPQLNRALIIDANVHDQDQRLTGRYHNTTLDTNKIIQALYYKSGASRA